MDDFDDGDELRHENLKEVEHQFDRRFRVSFQIGKGGFGKVLEGKDLQTDRKIAIKIESAKLSNPRLLYEYKIYERLKNTNGFPKAHNYASCRDENKLVLDLLGKSLETCFQDTQQKFTLEDVSFIAIQAINRIQAFHKAGFIHRDIKPDNIVFGRDKEANKLYMIDFGLAKKYMLNYYKVGFPAGKYHHINFEEGKSLIGTPRYCSINAASGKEQSRRDDLESLGYVLVYFLKGKEGLPWQNLKVKERLNIKEKYEYQLREDYRISQTSKKNFPRHTTRSGTV